MRIAFLNKRPRGCGSCRDGGTVGDWEYTPSCSALDSLGEFDGACPLSNPAGMEGWDTSIETTGGVRARLMNPFMHPRNQRA
jgi:hypothetical protein